MKDDDLEAGVRSQRGLPADPAVGTSRQANEEHEARGDLGEVASLRLSIPDAVHEQLRAHILSGQLTSGEKINQADLAKSLGTSRVPVREALRRLAIEGLVVLLRRLGDVVASVGLHEIDEIFQIRMILEERAGHVAAQRRTPNDVSALERILVAMDRAAPESAEALTEWAATNRKFHDRLFLSSAQLHLCRLVGMLRDSVERYIRLYVAMHDHRNQAQVEHHEILDAFREGDAAQVGRLCREHCRHTYEGLSAVMRAKGASQRASDPES